MLYRAKLIRIENFEPMKISKILYYIQKDMIKCKMRMDTCFIAGDFGPVDESVYRKYRFYRFNNLMDDRYFNKVSKASPYLELNSLTKEIVDRNLAKYGRMKTIEVTWLTREDKDYLNTVRQEIIEL